MNTMTKTAHLNARLEPELKAEAEAVFNQLGISTTEAVTMFLRQVVMQKGIPFPLRVPNAETIAAIKEAEADRKAGRLKRYATTAELFDDLNAEIEAEELEAESAN